jgi:BirA family biotin operon repressor/biotin-[acetyl-CoA-carboxylase] ligase
VSPAELAAALKTRDFGREAWLYDSLPSTQTRAQHLAFSGCAHGTLVYTREQTAGRGRAGRTWLSNAGALTFSLVLNRGIATDRASDWSFVAGLALRDAFAPYAPRPIALKWPNDVLLDGKKFAGILCSLEVGAVPAIAVGIGVNLETAPAVDRAGAWLGEQASHAEWLGRILRAFEYRAATHSRENTLAAFRAALAFVGEEVEVVTQLGRRTGVVRGISDDFELVLEGANGVEHIATADVWPLG